MTFEEVLDQAIALLQRRGRVTYRTLQRQFQLDEDALNDLKDELLYAHPQVYVDLGVISWILPRKEFHMYLRRLVEAGFGKRVMFGSDQMLWPQGLRIAIQAVETADFLTPAQKRDIFYNNAARFLRIPRRTSP